MKNLHPGARWQFRLKAYLTLLSILILLLYFLPLIYPNPINPSQIYMNILLKVFLTILFTIVIGEIYARMSYNRWLYEFTNTNLKRESGIIWKKYSNVPYERIQNIDIRRGILARFLGFSSIMIQTAGYSGNNKYGNAEGYLPAVTPEFAEKIRNFLMHKISKKRNDNGGLQ